jgi:hypothetical protein
MNRKFRNSLAAAFATVSLFAVNAASAATIDVIQDDMGTVILIKGELVDGDQVAFDNIANGIEDAIVVLESPGGDLVPGLEIGLSIRERGFNTLVVDGSECASACALAWMAGETRAMGEYADVGFHAAYVEVNHRPQETGAGNAIIGAYLNELGLSYDAIYQLTSAPPHGMYWLTFSDAESLGIEVERFQMADAPQIEPNRDVPSKG